MHAETHKPARQPILEPWRIAALVLIVVLSQLFVRAIEPAGAGPSQPGQTLTRP